MTRPVSIVIPAYAESARDLAPLVRGLEALVAEIDARGVEDQILVVDDTGRDLVRGVLGSRFPGVRVHVRRENGGFAAAVFTGAQAADYRLLLLLAADVVVHPGALAPLVEALQDPTVLAASPRVLSEGDEERPESRTRIAVEDGRLVAHELRGLPPLDEGPLVPIVAPTSAAMMVRREEFLAAGGFDDLFAPFGFEDVDLGLAARRRGRSVVEVPAAVVEHHGDGGLVTAVPEHVRRAARERNRLLLHWKHLGGKREAQDHLVSLWRDALDAGLCGRRDDLVWMALALDELDAVGGARAAMHGASGTLESVLDPG